MVRRARLRSCLIDNGRITRAVEGGLIDRSQAQPRCDYLNRIDALFARSKAQGGMMLRTIEDWKTLLRDKSPRDAAQRILRDIPHYRKGGGYECEDIEQLANAMQAFVSPRDEESANGP